MAEQEKAVDFSGVDALVAQSDDSGKLELWLKFTPQTEVTVETYNAVFPAVRERIDSGKKPAGQLGKYVDSVAHHVEQIGKSLSEMFGIYDRMVSTTPRKRVSATFKARVLMLEGMPLKMLKEYAGLYIPDEVDNYILSDEGEKAELINRLATIISASESNGDGEEQSSDEMIGSTAK